MQALRKIVVNGQTYMWSVTDFDCDGDHSSRIKIFRDRVLVDERLKCVGRDNPITPKNIMRRILKKSL